ncbi:MAG: hypothetical protein HRU12_07395 [Phaeodactylibacter sp.]|nr:hypothetical protein [Phaeodactylibacter sp.]
MKITIPSRLDEVTIQEYQNIVDIDVSSISDKEKWIRTIDLFIQKEVNYDLVSVADLQQVYQEIINLINKNYTKTHYRFEFNGVRYGLIPNLSEMTTQEFCDAMEMNEPKNIHLLLQVLYRPITNENKTHYDIEPYSADLTRAELFKGLPLNYYKGVALFFSTIVMDYWRTTKNYLSHQKTQFTK